MARGISEIIFERMDDEALRRELDGLHRTLEGAHNRINDLVTVAAEAKNLQQLSEQLQRQVEGAHSRLNEMSEALHRARTDAELARGRAAQLEERFHLLTDQLRQEGVSLGREALKLIERVLPAGPSAPKRRKIAKV